MTESYLLGELEENTRQEFEEHFFDCPECALDVRAASTFVEKSKVVLAEEPQVDAFDSAVQRPSFVKAGWLAWLRPALAAPALAVLLAVIGYQNLVTYPKLEQASNRAQVLPMASLSIGSMGSGDPVISIKPNQGFLLLVRIPPDNYPRHTVELYNPSGKLEWSLAIPQSTSQDQWPLQVPGAGRPAGTYRVVVQGATDSGDSKELGRSSFELQVQN